MPLLLAALVLIPLGLLIYTALVKPLLMFVLAVAAIVVATIFQVLDDMDGEDK